MALEREIEVAREVAVRAGEAALEHWRRGVDIETKADDSPVSAADRDAERIIAEGLAAVFPGDGLLGEEGCRRESSSGRRWIIDPVDGTRDFVRGSRNWAVQLALEEGENNVTAGVVHFPALEETYYAARGHGAWSNGKRIRVSGLTDVSRTVLCINDLEEFHHLPCGRNLLEWIGQFWAIRNPSGSPDAMMVACGRADGFIDPRSKAWDLAPHKIITEEAGGVFRNMDGGDSIYGRSCVTCTPALEKVLLDFLQSE